MKKPMNYYLPIISHYLDVPYDDKPRRVRVLLPRDYDMYVEESYPVVYMHDGQNVFYSKEAYSGHSWKLIPLIKNSVDLPKMIIVGIDNAGENRLDEYTPWPFELKEEVESHGHPGGMGIPHGEWIVNTVKPFIDKHYRTQPEREHTALVGSSLGGLITAYMGAAYPETFGSLGVFSLASWLSENAFLDFIDKNPLHPDTKVYIQVGTEEGNEVDETFVNKNINQAYIDSSLWYYQTMLRNGHAMENIWLRILADEHHFEKYWADHFGEYLQFTFHDK